MEKNYWRSRIVNGEEFTPAEQAELDRDWAADRCAHGYIIDEPRECPSNQEEDAF